MVTGNSINANGTGIQKYDGAGTFSGITVTNHGTLVGAASNGITSIVQAAGQVLIGTTAGDPSSAALTAGTGVTISSVSGAITINSIGGGLTWTDVTGTSQSMAINSGYTSSDGATLVTFTLPAVAAYGTMVAVVGKGSGLWTIVENTGQIIHFGSQNTTITSGSLSSTKQYDVVYLLCTVANTDWTVVEAIGNLSIV